MSTNNLAVVNKSQDNAAELDKANSSSIVESSDLFGTIEKMAECLDVMNEIIQKANFIALNASIEAARTQTQTENFSLVAEQVRRQAERTQELSTALRSEVGDLKTRALHAMAVNFTDVANDVIDKIDRNLFERNCDMQAWAGFREIVECTKKLASKTASEVKNVWNKKESEFSVMSDCCNRLENLTKTYNVYINAILINKNGVIISSAKDHNLIGIDLSMTEIVKQVIATKKTYVSEMFFDEISSMRTVAYTAPILNESGEVIGMISNRFNWEFVHDMFDKMPLKKNGKVFLISKDGTVLCSRNRQGILLDNLSWLMSGEEALKKNSGYTIECARNGQLSAWGFCHTFGYNAYEGKGWSAVVSHPIELTERRFLCEIVSREVEVKKQAAPDANRALQTVSAKIQDRVKSINTINNETNMLAVNAAIQAGVAGAEGEAFSVIASEIGQLARDSEEFVNNINELTSQLESCVRNTVFTRLGEAAFDTIDKIDRNLYERYCDVQAFAAFHEFSKFLVGETNDEKEILDLLRKLHDIYEVYHEVMLLDTDGNIKASAMHRELMHQNQSDRSWFRECLSGHIVVTDLYYSKSINDYSVTFAAPVRNKEGQIVGVLTTRFNCNFIYDIMKATIVGNEAQTLLVNAKGVLIGSPDGEGLLEKSFTHLKSFRLLSQNSYGYSVEEDKLADNQHFAIGYARTQGYISYKGKGWSVLIMQKIESQNGPGTNQVEPNLRSIK